jgi:hypothetical protein
MTKVLAQWRCCLYAHSSLHLSYGEENLLDDFHRAGPSSGFSAANMVGPGGHHSHSFFLVVGGLPQRMVLKPTPQAVGFNVMEKLPTELLHPVGVPLPTKLQEPVIVADVNVPVLLVPTCVPVSVPIKVPVSVRVLPLPCTV